VIKQCLGFVESYGLCAGIVAADTCAKAANVKIIGRELARGDGMTTIKIIGDVGAVKAAVASAAAAVNQMGKIVSVNVIPRPATNLDMLIYTKETSGLEEPVVPMGEPDRKITHPAWKDGMFRNDETVKLANKVERPAKPAKKEEPVKKEAPAPKKEEPVKVEEPPKVEEPKVEEPPKAVEEKVEEQPKAEEPVKIEEEVKKEPEAPKVEEPKPAPRPKSGKGKQKPRRSEPKDTEYRIPDINNNTEGNNDER
jgi:microcompartment protein CcmL/EutN